MTSLPIYKETIFISVRHKPGDSFTRSVDRKAINKLKRDYKYFGAENHGRTETLTFPPTENDPEICLSTYKFVLSQLIRL